MSSRTGSRRSSPAPPSDDGAAWITAVADGVAIRVHARPGAARSRIAGTHGGALKVQVRARPVDDAANREIIAVVAGALAVRPAAVTIASGGRSREKRLVVAGIDRATAADRLAPFVDKAPTPD